ncbi:MAG: hypothetical protein M3024_11670 [Candidatus Dormibacteraeota bacterium]|nr:hypothetical protein [Candidatus Dormibacteraeota bacterium]
MASTYATRSEHRRGRTAVLLVGLVLPALVAACGGSSSGSGSGSGGYGAAPAASPATKPASTAVIAAAAVTVAGKAETVLVNSKGMTLYYYAPDKGGKVTCTGGCAAAWPPLILAAGATAPAAPSGVSGTVATVANPGGGTQVTFNGWPLYTFAEDSAPGDVKGEGVGGKWFVVTSATPPSA